MSKENFLFTRCVPTEKITAQGNISTRNLMYQFINRVPLCSCTSQIKSIVT